MRNVNITKASSVAMNTNQSISSNAPKPFEMEALIEDFLPANSIGLCGNYSDTEETRFLLTPEVCGLLITSGFSIKMEAGAGSTINYSDTNYAEFGVEISDRAEVLKCDYVLSYNPLRIADIKRMKNGGVMVCMFDTPLFESSVIKAILNRNICVLCLDRVESHNGVPVFANIVDQVDGRTAIWYAQEAFSFLGGGKGVLLGGVAGINPCEVVILGEGTRAIAAARTAMAFGACVTLMDNDISALQLAQMHLGHGLVTSAIHPRSLTNKIKSADVILIDHCTHPFEFPESLKGIVKSDAYILDFNEMSPSLSTPRTVTQALATSLNNLFNEIALKGGLDNTIATSPGVALGVMAYNGHITDKLIASVTGHHYTDVEMLLGPAN